MSFFLSLLLLFHSAALTSPSSHSLSLVCFVANAVTAVNCGHHFSVCNRRRCGYALGIFSSPRFAAAQPSSRPPPPLPPPRSVPREEEEDVTLLRSSFSGDGEGDGGLAAAAFSSSFLPLVASSSEIPGGWLDVQHVVFGE